MISGWEFSVRISGSLKERVRVRDNFICQECGYNKGRILQAHHIKPFTEILVKYNIKTLEEALDCEELWDINNGITLCEYCHKKKTLDKVY